MSESRTLVVGAGIVGLSAAYFLARRGAAVTVVEQYDLDGSASTGNAGLIAVGHGPIPRPGLSRRGFRMLFDSSGPLYIPPRLDRRLLAWLWRFHRSCRPSHHTRSLEILAEHGRHAGACFDALVADESIECEYQTRGQMDVFGTDTGFGAGRHEADALRSLGYAAEIIGGAELRQREPSFRDMVKGAVLYEDRRFASPGAFVRALADRAVRQGAELRLRTSVKRLEIEGDRCLGAELETGERLDADQTVLAAGVWATALAEAAGVSIPMQAAKGYHLSLDAPATPLETASVLAERFVAVTPMEGGLRLAGTLEFSGVNHRFRPRRIEMLRAGAAHYLDGIDEAADRWAWCGMRPCTADGLPVIGWAPSVRSLFVATGHAMMGFTLGPLAGRMAAECILDGEPAASMQGFEPSRFV